MRRFLRWLRKQASMEKPGFDSELIVRLLESFEGTYTFTINDIPPKPHQIIGAGDTVITYSVNGDADERIEMHELHRLLSRRLDSPE